MGEKSFGREILLSPWLRAIAQSWARAGMGDFFFFTGSCLESKGETPWRLKSRISSEKEDCYRSENRSTLTSWTEAKRTMREASGRETRISRGGD